MKVMCSHESWNLLQVNAVFVVLCKELLSLSCNQLQWRQAGQQLEPSEQVVLLLHLGTFGPVTQTSSRRGVVVEEEEQFSTMK